jgi:hypothetical protein
VRGCEFRHDAPQVRLGEGVRRAVITDNVLAGEARIENKSRGRVAIAQNIAEGPP